jgi:hypothetical protein
MTTQCMNFTPELQQEIEQWADSFGLSTEEFVAQVMLEKVAALQQQYPLEDTPIPSSTSRLKRERGVLVIDTSDAGDANNFDINALIAEMREERIQDQIGKMGL